jgi:uncharacterized protein (TIGR03435 family)
VNLAPPFSVIWAVIPLPRTLLGAGLIVALAGPVFGQAAPAFEVADVRVSAPRMNLNPQMSGGAIRGGVYEVRNASMLDLVRTAYSIESDKVLGGPSWLEIDRFDVVAKAPEATTVETARVMLRRLLADRFKLVVRQDKREMNTWVLSEVSAGSAKVLRSQSAGIAPSCQGQPEPPNVKGVCRNMTIAGFIELLPRVAGAYVNGTITNATNLTGPWDFDITFTQNRAQLAELGAKGISLFDALEKQLGLKLEQKTITVDGFHVESVERTPTANVAGIEKILPPRPAPEFEVAEIKPTPPGNTQSRAQILPSGQINASAVPLREMINLAWGFNGNDMVVGPKWIEETRFDIVGKAFSGADAQFIDDEMLRLSLRKLLVDRFQIKFHFEERPTRAYALVAGNVKMTKADPSSRTRCYQGVPPGAKDPRQAIPTRGGLLTCQNVTMKYFAERLRGVAGGYVQAPITDLTGLDGGWDFTLNWSPINLFPGGVNGIGGRAGGGGPDGAAAGGGAEAAVPSGAITLPEAIESQLGLKLEMGRRPVSVLVIDQISEQPTGN